VGIPVPAPISPPIIPVSVITPASRGVDHLDHLVRDFKNQTFKGFEHIIVWDGSVPDDVRDFMKAHEHDYNVRFTNIEKDEGDMKAAPGTRPRNHGVSIALGNWVVFADDDDRYKDAYLETLVTNLRENLINVVQMSCQASRTYTNGREDEIRLVPEIGHPFPACGHVGTPCFIIPRAWAIEDPWQHEPDHDYRFLKRIIMKHNPTVRIVPGMQVDVDGLVVKDMKDWVSIPPMYRKD
jgi:glycosyltransferase involved in cell wall biosynthesis